MLSALRISSFDTIYQAAKLKQKQPIVNELQRASIDVYSGAKGTPISALAAEGDVASVAFLRDNFDPNKRWLVYGYGFSGKLTEAQAVLDQAAIYEEWLDLMTHLLKGMACGGHHINHVNRIFSTLTKPEQQLLASEVLFSYMQVNNADSANQWATANADMITPKDISFATIIAYVQFGENFKKLIKADEEYSNNIEFAVHKLAHQGHLSKALDSELANGDETLRRRLVYAAMQGAGRGGYHGIALIHIQNNDTIATKQFWIHSLLSGLARAGSLPTIHKIISFYNLSLNDYLFKHIIRNLITAGYILEAENFITQNAKESRWVTLTHYLLTGLQHDSSKPEFKKTIQTLVKNLQSQEQDINLQTTTTLLQLAGNPAASEPDLAAAKKNNKRNPHGFHEQTPAATVKKAKTTKHDEMPDESQIQPPRL